MIRLGEGGGSISVVSDQWSVISGQGAVVVVVGDRGSVIRTGRLPAIGNLGEMAGSFPVADDPPATLLTSDLT
jgi:hypothetical protein